MVLILVGQDGVDPGRAHAGLDTDLDTVDGVELNVVVVDEALDLRRKVGLKTFGISPAAVQQECAAVNQLLGHVELADVCRVVACNEVRLAYQIGGLDGLFAEAEVGHCDTAGLLGVIIEVCLCIHIGVVADDLDGVLVGTDSTVCAQTPELAADCAFGSGNDLFAAVEGQVCDIVRDTDGEGLLGGVVVAMICAGVVSLEPRP